MFKTFKNIVVFNLNTQLNETTLLEGLENEKFTGCTAFDYRRSGFVAPSKFSEQLVMQQGNQLLIALQTEEKILPSSVIKREFDEEIKSLNGRKLNAEEKRNLKDDITVSLLSRAFSRFTTTHAIVDIDLQRIIINTSSQSKAQDFVSQLRRAIGDLPATPLSFINTNAEATMTDWVRDELKLMDFNIDDEIEFRSKSIEGEQAQIVKSKHMDIDSWELNELKGNLNVHKLAMTWNDKISFVLDDELCIKRLRYLDEFTEQRQESDDEASIFYADFILLSNSLAMLVDAVIDVMKTEEQAQ